VCTRNVSWE